MLIKLLKQPKQRTCTALQHAAFVGYKVYLALLLYIFSTRVFLGHVHFLLTRGRAQRIHTKSAFSDTQIYVVTLNTKANTTAPTTTTTKPVSVVPRYVDQAPSSDATLCHSLSQSQRPKCAHPGTPICCWQCCCCCMQFVKHNVLLRLNKRVQ